jgi:hypothetical protein
MSLNVTPRGTRGGYGKKTMNNKIKENNPFRKSGELKIRKSQNINPEERENNPQVISHLNNIVTKSHSMISSISESNIR